MNKMYMILKVEAVEKMQLYCHIHISVDIHGIVIVKGIFRKRHSFAENGAYKHEISGKP